MVKAVTECTLLGALVVTYATLLCPMYCHIIIIIIIIILLLLLFSTRFASIRKMRHSEDIKPLIKDNQYGAGLQSTVS